MNADTGQRGGQTGNQTGAAAPPPPLPAGDSILSTIQELEARFSGLKQVHEQTVQREQELAARAAALAKVEAELRERGEQLGRRAAEVETQARQAVELRERVGRERSEVDAQRTAAERGLAEAEIRAKESEERGDELARAERALNERTALIERQNREIEESRGAIAELEARLGEREQGVAAAQKRSEELGRESSRRAEQVEAEGKRLEASRAAAAERERALAEREHVVSEHDKRVAEREQSAGAQEKKNAGLEFKLAEARQALEREREAYAERERGLLVREKETAARLGEAEELKKKFAEQAVRVAEREQGLEACAAGLAERERAVVDEVRGVKGLEEGLAGRENAAAQRERETAQAQERAAIAEREAEERRGELEARERAVAELGAAAAERERTIGERERALAETGKALEEQQSALEELEQGVRGREGEIGSARKAMEEREQGLAAKREAAAVEARAAREELARVRGEFEEREKKLAESERSIKERLAEVRLQADKVERDRAAVTEQARTLTAQASAVDPHHGGAIFSGRMEQIQIQLGEATAKRAATETELTQAKGEIARLSEELRGVSTAASRVKDSGREEIQRRESAMAALERELAESREELRETGERLGLAERAAAGAVSAERAAEQEAEITTLREQLSRASAGDGGAGIDGVSAVEIAKRDRAIGLLKERLDEAEFRAAELAETLEAAQGESDKVYHRPERSADPASRRERLRRYKSLLQAQARKIVTAQAAIQKRHSDCEQVLAQRARLAGVAAEVTRREKRIESAKARGGAAAAVLYAVATVAILAVLSWQVAGRVWPGTYAARAVIEADTHGRVASANELTTWNTYHRELLSNPALIEMAAERMARRGLVQYGSAAELGAKLKTDLYSQSEAPERLTIELKNQGAEKARLALDTFVTALKSVSDAQRDQRPDDLGVMIAQAAAVGPEPLTDSTLERAGALLAGGTLAAGLFGMVIWTRLAKAKHKFEHAHAVEAALNEVDWSAMEVSFKKAAAAVPVGGGAKAGGTAKATARTGAKGKRK